MADSNWLLDTSVLIDLLRGSESANRWISALDIAVRHISVVTAAELIAGCRNKREQSRLNSELKLYQIVWLDETMSKQALELYQNFHLSHGIGFLDCLIAATALERKFRLATLNLKHFPSITGLEAERPF